MQSISTATGQDGQASSQASLALDDCLSGVIERITFHSRDTGFCVLQVRARGHRRPVAVVGYMVSASVGEAIDAKGCWEHHRAHGAQFRAESMSVSAPADEDDLRRFLASGLIRGVGPALARRLFFHFGSEVLDAIEHRQDDVASVKGIGAKRAKAMAGSWAMHRAARELENFLCGLGIGGSAAHRIHRAYGQDACAVITADPYRLAVDLPDFDFATADHIAARMGIKGGAPVRLRAGIASVLAEAAEEGHCGLPLDDLAERACILLNLPVSNLLPAIDTERAAGSIVADMVAGRSFLFPRKLHRAEMVVAERLRALSQGAVPWGVLSGGEAVARAEAALGIAFGASQREALQEACRSKVLVVTGGPGVGKTTLLRGLLHILREKRMSVALAAPTGRAARRLAAATGREAKTLHRLLGASQTGLGQSDLPPLECDLLVIDEASMVDVRLMAAVLRATPDGTALLLLGDVDQLPSIGPGQILSDLIGSEAIPVVRLREVFRQDGESRIIEAAHAINRGEVPDLQPRDGSDFYFIEATGADEVMAKLVTLVRDRIPNRFGLDPVRDIQVLCPVNRGGLGAHHLNVVLQAAMNPVGPALVRAGWTFRVGDKVMQVRNDYERDVSNGELGIVTEVDLEENHIEVGFEDRLVSYPSEELDELALAYATTVHKAQGSEFPAVIIPVLPQHAPRLRRSLLYTGVSRASRLVVLLGSRAALLQAVRNGGTGRRWSRLETLLRERTGLADGVEIAEGR